MDEIAALKQALLDGLKANSALVALVGNRIYDVPPSSPAEMTSPYIRLGPFNSQDDGPECFESYDITGQIDVYSWGVAEAASTMESLKISRLVRDVIDGLGVGQEIEGGHVLTEARFLSKRSITASDGKTKHVPITISAIVDKT